LGPLTTVLCNESTVPPQVRVWIIWALDEGDNATGVVSFGKTIAPWQESGPRRAGRRSLARGAGERHDNAQLV
jgi:hypothetical protein